MTPKSVLKSIGELAREIEAEAGKLAQRAEAGDLPGTLEAAPDVIEPAEEIERFTTWIELRR